MTKSSNMLPPVAAVLPAEKLNETLVKWGLLPCCRFSRPLSINLALLTGAYVLMSKSISSPPMKTKILQKSRLKTACLLALCPHGSSEASAASVRY